MSENILTLCTYCGASPCYHICPNSEHYYSPEQERYDDQFYGEDDHRERYAAERADAEAEQYMDDFEIEAVVDPRGRLPYPDGMPIDPNDIPF